MLKHLTNYASATIISSVVAFLTIPFFTRYLTPDDFGVLAIYFMFGSITTNLLSIGLQVASIRYYYSEKNNLDYFGSLNFTNFVFIAIMFLVGGVAIWFNSNRLAKFIFDDKVSKEIILISFVGGSISSLYTYLKQLLIPQQRSNIYSAVTIIGSIIAPGAAIILILLFSMTYYARIYGKIFSDSLLLILMLFVQCKSFRLKLSKDALKRSIAFSYPQIPQEMIGLVQHSFDKIMLTNMKELGVVGNYQIAQKLAGFSKTIISTISRAWIPFFMNKAELKTEKGKMEIVVRYYEVIALYNLLSFLLCCFSEEVVRLLTTKAFYPSMYILPIVIFSILFAHILSTVSKPQLVFAEKMIYTLPPSIVALTTNVVLNVILIPPFGAMGAVLATLAASIASGIMLFYFAQKAYPLPIEYRKLCAILSLFIIFQIPVYCTMLLGCQILYKIAIKFVIIAIYFSVYVRIGFVNFNKLELLVPKCVQFNKYPRWKQKKI